jgi:hypothetical protein
MSFTDDECYPDVPDEAYEEPRIFTKRKQAMNDQDPFSENESPPEGNHSTQGFSSADDFLSGGIPSAKFNDIGVMHQGVITAFEVGQQRDINTGQPKFWPDGKPCEQMVITIQTKERDSAIDDDDGERRLYVNRPGGMYSALTAAIKVSKSKFVVGGSLAIKYVGNGTPTKKGHNPPKQYIAKYTPPGAQIQTNTNIGDGKVLASQAAYVSPNADAMAARKAAGDAFQAKYPGIDNSALVDDWKAHLKFIFPDKISTQYTVADWQTIERSLKVKPAPPVPTMAGGGVEPPFGDESVFDPDSIQF